MPCIAYYRLHVQGSRLRSRDGADQGPTISGRVLLRVRRDYRRGTAQLALMLQVIHACMLIYVCRSLGVAVGLVDLSELGDLAVAEDDRVVLLDATGVPAPGNADAEGGVVPVLSAPSLPCTHATRSLPSR